METIQKLKQHFGRLVKNLHSDATVYLGMMVLCLGFLDTIGRYSYQYIGWWSYLTGILIFCLATTLPWLKLQELKYVFKICTGTSLIAVGWFVFKKLEEGQYEFSVLMFTIHVLIQLLLGLLTCCICSVKAKIRFLVYLYIFMLEGITLKISPSWLYNILVMKTIFYLVLIFLYIIENGIDYSLKDLGAYFRKEELLIRLNDLIQNDRMDAFWYFLLMSATVFIHNWSIASNSEEYLGMKWVLLCTLGSCCNSLLALFSFCKFFTCMSILIFKACSAFIKGWDDRPIIISSYNLSVMIMIADLLFYNMHSFERGELFVRRIWILFVLIAESCSSVIGIVSSELEILQCRFLTSISVIVIHTLFIVFPVVVVDLLVNVYSMADLSIFLTTSNFIMVTVQTFFSLFIFLLYKYDSRRDENWEHFDDVIFYIRLGCDILKTLINSFTVCYGVYTIFFGSYSFHEILRIYSLCYMNIYRVIQKWKAILHQRGEVVQFTANLPDASKEQIEDNNDVCSICLQDMKIVKITPCNHLYHEMCLRKWLNTKTDCPLCSEKIIITNRT